VKPSAAVVEPALPAGSASAGTEDATEAVALSVDVSSPLSPQAARPITSASAGTTKAAGRHLLPVIGRPLARDPRRT